VSTTDELDDAPAAPGTERAADPAGGSGAETWFARLPEEAQELLQRRWRAVEDRDAAYLARCRRNRIRTVLEVIALFTLIWFVLHGLSLQILAASVVAGGATALAIHALPCDRVVCGVTGTCGFVAQVILLGVRHPMGIVWSVVAAVFVFALYGVRREMRQLEGNA
jgi:hypothetical protein